MFPGRAKFNRMTMFLIIVVLIFGVIVSRLAVIQLINGEYYREIAEAMGERPKTEIAPRGEILDRNGSKLAINNLNYSVIYSFSEDKNETGSLNLSLINMINILYKNEDENKLIIDSFPLEYDITQNLFKYKVAARSKYELVKQTKIIKEKNKIETNFDKGFNYDLIQELEYRLKGNNDSNFRNEEIKKFEEQHLIEFNESRDAEEVLMQLASRYSLIDIDSNGKIIYSHDSLSNNPQKLVKVAALRYKLKASLYRQYEDIDLAKGIKKETAWEIQIKSNELEGITTQITPVRYYPYGETGSAFIGYMGKISNAEKYKRLGYDINRELIGVNSLEYVLENRENNNYDIQLRGEPGVSYVKVDKYGKIIEETGRLEAIPGDSVEITIDIDMQAAAEKALDATMLKMREGGFGKKLKAQRGAAVVVDIDTGEILALASRPGFDPNYFAETGVPKELEIIKKLQLDNPEELYEDKYDSIPRPMFNYAAQGAVMPGSTFKPFSAIAGLEEGVITKNTIIYDDGLWDNLPGIRIKGWTYDSRGTGFGAINVADALKYSSNYFFNEVGYRLGFEKFSKWAQKFGLVRENGKRPSTGIEISELPGSVGTPEESKRRTAYSVIRDIVKTLKEQKYGGYIIDYGTMYYDGIFEMLVDGSFDESRLDELGTTNKEAKKYIQKKVSYVQRFSINQVDVLNMAMGQGYVSLTPVQMAQYLSTLLNGGTRYGAHLVKRVLNPDGTIKRDIEPEVIGKVDLNPDNIATVKEGMRKVAEEPGGTARAAFGNYPVKIGAKTGTAQPGVGEIMKYRDNYSWFVSFAPFDKPEIAVATVVYDGGSGGYSAEITKSIYDIYFKDRPEMKEYLTKKANNK